MEIEKLAEKQREFFRSGATMDIGYRKRALIMLERALIVWQYKINEASPLALYLFTSDKKTKKMFLNNVAYGGGCINDTIIHLATSRMGFGGVGDSGMGSYHGKRALKHSAMKRVLSIR